MQLIKRLGKITGVALSQVERKTLFRLLAKELASNQKIQQLVHKMGRAYQSEYIQKRKKVCVPYCVNAFCEPMAKVFGSPKAFCFSFLSTLV